MNITIERAVLEQALEALNHGITEMNHRGCAIECMPLHHATKALRDALAHQQPVQPLTPEHRLSICKKAEAAMDHNPNLAWRNALITETEAAIKAQYEAK